MSGDTKRYWKPADPATDRDRPAQLAADPDNGGSTGSPQLSRRGFLKTVGFAVPAVMAGCSRAPVENAIPFLVQPEAMVPGEALWYASTCFACEAACGLLAKNRDGRAIKLEGSPEHPLSQGGLCARGQAAVLELYDSQRLGGPLRAGKPVNWADVDPEVSARFDKLRAEGGAVRFLTGTVVSPTKKRLIDTLLSSFADARHVTYDALSRSAILQAHRSTHAVRVLPRYRFDHADVIVSFDADFLGTWISPVEYAAAWRKRRRPTVEEPAMSFHLQVETRLSVTGSKADQRWVVRPSQIADLMARVAAAVAHRAGQPAATKTVGEDVVSEAKIEALADRLWQARGRSLVVCGINDLRLQTMCNELNDMLGAYGPTIDIDHPSRQADGDDRDLAQLLDELAHQKVAALLVDGVNPAYDLSAISDLAEHLRAVPLLISFAGRNDETAQLATYVCPDHHPLESWGDAQPVSGIVSLAQPVMAPMGETRPVIETLALWGGTPRPALHLVRETWEKDIYPLSREQMGFDKFWDESLERGVVEVSTTAPPWQPSTTPVPAQSTAKTDNEGMELVLYASLAMGDGRHAHNPWLHELPDSITKVTWDNFASVSPADAARLGIKEGDVLRIEAASENEAAAAVEVPAFVQPGQAEGTVAVALGYGRDGTQRFASIGPQWIQAPKRSAHPPPVGVSTAPLIEWNADHMRQYQRSQVRVAPAGAHRALACTQTYHSLEIPKHLVLPGLEKRDIVHEMSLAQLVAGKDHEEHIEPTLWPDDHTYTGHHWALTVDLNACTGCSACVIACQAENNIPVVGRDEVRRRREMHWLRIDTYYTGDGSDVDVAHMPMMCQQCDNAPCETVCPVLATVHSKEGLNEQVYNRCVGTRYCANNCPYKVRRFNWFNYRKEREREDLVLNPDVTVRSRGIMEKCTFCVQRIARGKIEARAAGLELADGTIQMACEQSCPSHALVFGDSNDPKSRLARMMASPRRYRVLDELGVRPSVGYLAIVRNESDDKDEVSHG